MSIRGGFKTRAAYVVASSEDESEAEGTGLGVAGSAAGQARTVI